ncbi:AAA family ATPase [Microbacterium sp. 22179]|uniref:AAA family ATPase n=1 Tax=Microbacterium sp. 22179 TaxID=3453886 RepID=UPI003F849246
MLKEVYDYEDEDGVLKYQVTRWEPKDFRQRRPDPDHKGKWLYDMKGVELLPFNLPAVAELVEHGTEEDDLWIVEGEKDVLALEQAYGAVATCNSGGANKWTDAHSEYIAGFKGNYIIVIDNDDSPKKPGQKHALSVYESLLRVAGIEAELVYPVEGKDAADVVGKHDPDDGFVLVTPEMLRAEIDDAAKDEPDAAAERDERIEEVLENMRIQREARARLAAEFAKASFSGFTSVSLREALAKPREVKPAIVRGLQMQGHKATLTAQFKAGKTTLAGNLVRSLADSEPFLERFEVADLPGNIGIFDYELTEDDAFDMYAALGLRNTDRVFLESLRGEGFSLANEFHREQAVRWLTERDIVYWVIDPFGRALRGFGSENANDDVRVFLDTIDEVVERTGVIGTLMPVHTGRMQHEVGAEHGRGATVVDDDADARWLLTRDNNGRRFFRAEGRNGVGVEEVSLEFEAATSRLSTGTVTRAQSKGERLLPSIEDYLVLNPGAGTNDIRKEVDGGNTQIDAAIKLGISKGTVRVEQNGQKRAHFYVPAPKLTITKEASE